MDDERQMSRRVNDVFPKIEGEIRTGKYSRNEKFGRYNKCNLFADDAASIFGVSLPRNTDDWRYRVTSSLGIHGGQPGRAPFLEDYYKNRSRLPGSGVYPVEFEEISKIANQGGLVLVLGQGHASLAAPDETGQPKIYRSDLSNRSDDERVKVGIKDGKKFEYFYIDPEEYNMFNSTMQRNGYSDFDIGSPFTLAADDDADSWESQFYDRDTNKERTVKLKSNPAFNELFGDSY